MTTSPWVAIHVSWSTLDERRQLLAGLSEMPGPWWFADLDREMEVAARGRAPESDAATRGPHQPCALSPELFPNRSVPRWYPDLLALTTARLYPLLAAGRPPEDPEALIAAEIDVIYRSLVADATWRANALRTHSAWLRRADHHPGDELVPASSTTSVTGKLPARPVEDPDLVTYRAALAALARDRPFAEKVVADGGQDADGRGQIVARLAHTQAVRIVGPRAGSLRREALITARLAAAQ